MDNGDYVENEHHNNRQHGVDQKQQELLPVEESHTAAQPGAVMVHPQNALLATRAVVATSWFETMANHAVSFLTGFGLVHVESLLLGGCKSGVLRGV